MKKIMHIEKINKYKKSDLPLLLYASAACDGFYFDPFPYSG